jgi:hypothetical protein
MIARRIAMLLRILCGIIEIIMFGMIVGRMLAKLVNKRCNYGKNMERMEGGAKHE